MSGAILCFCAQLVRTLFSYFPKLSSAVASVIHALRKGVFSQEHRNWSQGSSPSFPDTTRESLGRRDQEESNVPALGLPALLPRDMLTEQWGWVIKFRMHIPASPRLFWELDTTAGPCQGSQNLYSALVLGQGNWLAPYCPICCTLESTSLHLMPKETLMNSQALRLMQ